MPEATKSDLRSALNTLSLVVPLLLVVGAAVSVQSLVITQNLYGSGSLFAPVAFFAAGVALTRADNANKIAGFILFVLAILIFHWAIMVYVYEEIQKGTDLSKDIFVWVITIGSVLLYIGFGFWKHKCDQHIASAQPGFSEND